MPFPLLAALSVTVASAVAATEPVGAAFENVPYPFPVHEFPVELGGRTLRMAYMDVPPSGKGDGRAVVLFHGKNFWGAYFERPARALSAAGFRVIIPDQLGFGRSAKPDMPYSFELLAHETHRLLDALGVKKAAVVGHSMGGMLATRFALMYPDVATHLVLENPIGLEDYREKVPYATVDEQTRRLLGTTEEGVRRLYRAYFATWRDEYAALADVAWRQTLGGEWPRVARASALTYEMIYTQPVVQDFPRVRVPTLLVIGQADRTAVGRESVPEEVLATMGRYPELGRRTARAIPGAKLVELAGVGHVPHLEAPERFERELLGFLGGAR